MAVSQKNTGPLNLQLVLIKYGHILKLLGGQNVTEFQNQTHTHDNNYIDMGKEKKTETFLTLPEMLQKVYNMSSFVQIIFFYINSTYFSKTYNT